MVRGAAKNFKDVTVIASKEQYPELEKILTDQNGETTLEQRKYFAVKAFDVCTGYDIAISNHFNGSEFANPFARKKNPLRYGENPHQQAEFYGNLDEIFEQLHGKELSYNNLVDVDAAIQLMQEFTGNIFAVIKHTNVCGIAAGDSVKHAWEKALQGDPESAFGGVLIANNEIDEETAAAIGEIFFEVLIAPSFSAGAIKILSGKKNRILLRLKKQPQLQASSRSILNGTLTQQVDTGNFSEWREEGGKIADKREKEDLEFANLVCKHLKSNAIALVKNRQLVGKGCGQTSRIDALRQAIAKAKQFQFDLAGAVMASDAFFPFDDCVKIAGNEGITAFIQPGGSIRDKDSIEYCRQHNLSMVITGMRHFKH